MPTKSPSYDPSSVPSKSQSPSKITSLKTTESPSFIPSDGPSSLPSYSPTRLPSNALTYSPSNEPSTMPTGETCDQNSDCRSEICEDGTCMKITGEICSHDSECSSKVCRNRTCYESDACKKLKHTDGSAFDKDTIVLVFVGSGFTSLDAWRAQVRMSYSSFHSTKMFDDNNPLFISLYVNKLFDPICKYGEVTLRFLSCEMTDARVYAEKCFPTGPLRQTIVVHNNSTYGGIGSSDYNFAALSIHARGPDVAIHELGHSLFNLADEYNLLSKTTNSSLEANCDTQGCSKWSDLVDNGYASCTIKACNTGPNLPDYFVGALSFMDNITLPVGHVNWRFTCCTFLALTKTTPDYCEEYNSGVFEAGDLLEYCSKNDYQWNGKENYPNYTISDTITQEGTSGKYVYLENAKQLLISKDFEYVGSSSRMNSNLHLRSEIFGDIPHEKLSFFAENGDAVKITIVFSSGERLVQFRKKHYLVHGPLSEFESDSSESDPLDVKLPIPYLYVVVDGNKGDVIDVIVTDVVFSF